MLTVYSDSFDSLNLIGHIWILNDAIVTAGNSLQPQLNGTSAKSVFYTSLITMTAVIVPYITLEKYII